MKSVFIEMEKLENLNSGLGQFCLNMGEEFQKLKPEKLELNFYVPSSKENIFGEEFRYVRHTPLHKLLPVSSGQYNIWHCLQQDSHFFPRNKNTKLILTIHDLNFLEKYKGIRQKNRLNSLQKKVNAADVITVISKYTKEMVCKHLKLKDKPVYTIYNGNSLKVIPNAEKPTFVNFENYFFSIGIIAAKKNFHVLLPLLQHFKQTHLVIAGNNTSAYAKQLLIMAEEAGVLDRLHLVGTINEPTKYWLYKNCSAFVFPSLSEGFGMPVVEAMSLGKPVFLSDCASLPEVGGPEAYYWKIFEAQHLIEIVEKGLLDFASDINKAERSINWANQFSWKNAAKAYLKLYEDL